MSADPFAEPGDTEHTIFRPRPAGTADATATTRGDAVPVPKVGDNPLVAAASPVLAAIIRIADERAQPPDPEKLRIAMTNAIRGFEKDALKTGLEVNSLRAARYALCATIDDLVLSTPWGSRSSWVQHSITSVFHNEVIGGERFYDILEEMQKDLGHHAPVVELMFLCTSLGFEGRYRVSPRGTAALAELRDGVYRTLRQRRGDFERELSPHWRGLAESGRALARRIPIWFLALATLAVAGAMYMAFSFLLASRSDVAYAELSALPPKDALPIRRTQLRTSAQSAAPVENAPIPGAFTQHLRQFLAPEIRAGLVQVLEDAQTVTVRLANRNMFGSGEAVLGTSYPPLLVRIGDALETDPGQVTVFGYTDNQAIRTARFPSNFELSQARAEIVATALRARLKDPARVTAKGRGEANPIAPNTTPDGRLQNRRTEIVLTRAPDAL
jgi:type VI secretion system protein ImpK